VTEMEVVVFLPDPGSGFMLLFASQSWCCILGMNVRFVAVVLKGADIDPSCMGIFLVGTTTSHVFAALLVLKRPIEKLLNFVGEHSSN
jgi:hypothetical protein